MPRDAAQLGPKQTQRVNQMQTQRKAKANGQEQKSDFILFVFAQFYFLVKVRNGENLRCFTSNCIEKE